MKTPEEKLGHDLLSGRSKKEIAEELVASGEFSEDRVWEFIHDFEQHLLGGLVGLCGAIVSILWAVIGFSRLPNPQKADSNEQMRWEIM